MTTTETKGGLAMSCELKLASRSWSNESEGKDMFGCIADEYGRVVCYFPTRKMFEAHAERIKIELEESR